MKPWQFDGVLTGGPDGRTYEVFAPRWWELGRWLWWWRRPKSLAKMFITFDGLGSVTRVRAFEVPSLASRRR